MCPAWCWALGSGESSAWGKESVSHHLRSPLHRKPQGGSSGSRVHCLLMFWNLHPVVLLFCSFFLILANIFILSRNATSPLILSTCFGPECSSDLESHIHKLDASAFPSSPPPPSPSSVWAPVQTLIHPLWCQVFILKSPLKISASPRPRRGRH